VDREGFVWNCRYGGECIVRLAPDGSIDRVIEIPVDNVTSCTFGGPDLRTLYITSAFGVTRHERFAGGFFEMPFDAPGQRKMNFRRSKDPRGSRADQLCDSTRQNLVAR
jgi:sugar lactone lactonase YvrE